MTPFRVGQWARLKATGQAVKLVGSNALDAPNIFLVANLDGIRVFRRVDDLEPYVPRKGDRCTCIGARVGYQAGFFGRPGTYRGTTEFRGEDWHVFELASGAGEVELHPTTEFAPLPEPEKRDTMPGASFNGVQFPVPDEPALVNWEWAVDAGKADEAQRKLRAGNRELERAVTPPNPPFYTHGTPIPDIRKRRLESAKEQLGGKWGKR